MAVDAALLGDGLDRGIGLRERVGGDGQVGVLGSDGHAGREVADVDRPVRRACQLVGGARFRPDPEHRVAERRREGLDLLGRDGGRGSRCRCRGRGAAAVAQCQPGDETGGERDHDPGRDAEAPEPARFFPGRLACFARLGGRRGVGVREARRFAHARKVVGRPRYLASPGSSRQGVQAVAGSFAAFGSSPSAARGSIP